MAPKVDNPAFRLSHNVQQNNLSGGTILFAALATLVVAGPLICIMGFVLMATLTLLLFAVPLFLIFSPVLVPAGLFLAGSMASFGVAITMGLFGASALTWAVRATGEVVPDGVKRIFGVGDFNVNVGTGYLKEKADRHQPMALMNLASSA